MILKLDIERVRTIGEVRDFMTGSEPVDFHLTDRRGCCRSHYFVGDFSVYS